MASTRYEKRATLFCTGRAQPRRRIQGENARHFCPRGIEGASDWPVAGDRIPRSKLMWTGADMQEPANSKPEPESLDLGRPESRIDCTPENIEQGLAKLVLSLIE